MKIDTARFRLLGGGSLLGSFVSVGAANLITFGLGAVASWYLARALSSNEYGKLIYYTNWFGTLFLFTALGMGPKISKDVSEARGDSSELGMRFWSLLAFRGVTIGIVTGAVLAYAVFSETSILAYAAVAAAFAVLARFAQAALGGLQDIVELNLVIVLQPIIYLLGVVVLLPAYARHSAQGAMGTHAVSFLLASILGGWFVWRAGIPSLTRSSISFAFLRASLRFIGLVFLLNVVRHFYRVFVTMIMGLQGMYEEVAAFGVPLNLITLALGLFDAAMIAVLYPRMCALRQAGNLSGIVDILDGFVRLGTLVALWVAVVVAAYPAEILTLIYSVKYVSSATTLAILAPLVCLSFISMLLSYALLVFDRPGRALLGYAAQFLLLVLGSLFATAALATLGSVEHRLAIVYTVSSLFGLAFLWFQVKQELHIILRPRGMARGLLPLISASIMLFGLRLVASSQSTGWVYVVPSTTLVYALGLALGGAVRRRHGWLVRERDG